MEELGPRVDVEELVSPKLSTNRGSLCIRQCQDEQWKSLMKQHVHSYDLSARIYKGWAYLRISDFLNINIEIHAVDLIPSNNPHLCSTVVGKTVGSARRNTADGVGGRKSLDAVAQRNRRARTLESQKVGTKTSNVGASHGGTGEGPGTGASVGGGNDSRARGKDINDGTVVGEGGAGIGRVDGADSACVRGGRRVCVCGVDVGVAGGDSDKDTVAGGGGDGVADGLPRGLGAAKGQVGGGAGGAAAGGAVAGEPGQAGDDVRGIAASGLVADLDGDELGLLGNTVGVGADGTSDVGTVTLEVGVGLGLDVVHTLDGTSTKVGVGGVDTRVNNVRAGSLTSRGIVDIGGGSSSAAVGDLTEPISGAGLAGESSKGQSLVWLNVLDLRSVN